jgi:hypothetical protein
MALVVAAKRLMAIPYNLDRAADPALVQAEGGQCEKVLDGQVFTAPEGSAGGGIDHANLVQRQIKHVRNLMLVIVIPLSRRVHGYTALLIDEANTGLRL